MAMIGKDGKILNAEVRTGQAGNDSGADLEFLAKQMQSFGGDSSPADELRHHIAKHAAKRAKNPIARAHDLSSRAHNHDSSAEPDSYQSSMYHAAAVGAHLHAARYAKRNGMHKVAEAHKLIAKAHELINSQD